MEQYVGICNSTTLPYLFSGLRDVVSLLLNRHQISLIEYWLKNLLKKNFSFIHEGPDISRGVLPYLACPELGNLYCSSTQRPQIPLWQVLFKQTVPWLMSLVLLLVLGSPLHQLPSSISLNISPQYPSLWQSAQAGTSVPIQYHWGHKCISLLWDVLPSTTPNNWLPIVLFSSTK